MGSATIGAGLIFVRQDRVTGLTTAATLWLVTAIGMACGAGLIGLGVTVFFLYFIVALLFPLVIKRLPSYSRSREQESEASGRTKPLLLGDRGDVPSTPLSCVGTRTAIDISRFINGSITVDWCAVRSEASSVSITFVRFAQVNLNDPFFDSLKADYAEFAAWFQKKADHMAYVSTNEQGSLDGFLYLKIEDEEHSDVVPPLAGMHRLKVGTFKIDAHGTKLGDRFVKKLFDRAMADHVKEVYVTIFDKHAGLIKLLTRYGFKKWGTKDSPNGAELVLVRSMHWEGHSLHENYPLVQLSAGNKYFLALYPQWHTRLLPDSKLIGEGPDVVNDISHTNSIQKIYLAGRSGAQNLKHGDAVVIYRTSDNQGPAYYRSVATSVCVVDKVELITEYATEESFLSYSMPFSVFTEGELKHLYKTKQYPVIITFTYNISFPKRITRKALIEEVGLDPNARWTCLQITEDQFLSILSKGQVDENFVVD